MTGALQEKDTVEKQTTYLSDLQNRLNGPEGALTVAMFCLSAGEQLC